MPAPTDDPDRWRRCVHEAGHCLISRLAGLGWGAGSTVAYGRGFTWCNHDDGRAGIAVGLAGAFALTRLLSNLLFGVSSTDPLTFGAVALGLSLVAAWAFAVDGDEKPRLTGILRTLVRQPTS